MAVSTRSVLVVEDEPAIRGLVSLLLEDEGYIVDSASNGQEAFSRLQHQPPDALIVDLDLPIMNGSDLVQACRSDENVRHIPIIAISAVYGSHTLQNLDVQEFLAKPFSMDTLLNVLCDVLS